MANIAALKARNDQRWKDARITRGPEFAKVAPRLVANKARYQTVAAVTGVPWFIIAVIHQRESAANFSGVLHNGEHIIGTGRKTRLVPSGRGPFSSWEEAAIDALKNCHPYAARWTDWSPGGAMTLLEQYNGLGYANKGLPSPYVWSGTDRYVKGKYVADGKFDPDHVDKQLGCAGLILAMRQVDPSIAFAGERPSLVPAPVPQPEEKPDAAGKVAAGTAAAGAAGYGVWQFASDYWMHAAAAAVALIIVFIIGFRLIKGRFPWTGRSSQVSSVPSLQPSEDSLDQLSAQLAALSAASRAAPLPAPLASRQRRKRSAKRSPKTGTPWKNSASSKRPKQRRSSKRRASKSKG